MSRRSRWTALLLALVLLLAAAAPALADFRHARIGARPKALGSAFVSLVDDANAAYWNPAGLTRNDRVSFMATRAWLYSVPEIYEDYLCLDLNRLGPISVGASWVRLGIDGIYSENTVNLALAARVPRFERLSVGVAGKLFFLEAPGYERYNDPNYNGGDHDISFDVGLHYDGDGPWTLGAVLYNVTEPELQLLQNTSKPDPVYTEWAAGGSYLFRDALLLTVDLRNREGRWADTVAHGGAEIWFFEALALRGGIDEGLLTIGAGLQDVHWEVDFCLATHKELGDVYMISVTVRN
ncbi:MAG: hypothetical protein R6X25_06715 [Candidatus Krumholzibacteriia bacterium]